MKGLQLTAAPRTNDTLAMNVLLEERPIGRVLVARNKYDGTCSIQDLYVEPEARSARLTGHVLLEAIKMTQREFGVASIGMYKGYAEPRAAENDSWLKVARFVIGLKVERRETERGFYVSTAPSAQQNRRLYTAARLEREGFSFLSWAECDEGVRRQIEGLRGETDPTKRWLPTDFPDCDADLTVIGLYRGEVCGWMILKRLSDDDAECLRWYAVKKFRRISAGVKTSGHFFRHIGEKCRRLRFFVKLDNTATMKFYQLFFRDSIEVFEYGYRYLWRLGGND